jgi:hypothetical protein
LFVGCGDDDDAQPMSAGSRASQLDAGANEDHHADAQVARPANIDASTNRERDGGGCESLKCQCGLLCDKIAMLQCENDAPRAECEELCLSLEDDPCGDAGKLALHCRVNLPSDAYACEPRLKANMIVGCENEVDAYAECLGP